MSCPFLSSSWHQTLHLADTTQICQVKESCLPLLEGAKFHDSSTHDVIVPPETKTDAEKFTQQMSEPGTSSRPGGSRPFPVTLFALMVSSQAVHVI